MGPGGMGISGIAIGGAAGGIPGSEMGNLISVNSLQMGGDLSSLAYNNQPLSGLGVAGLDKNSSNTRRPSTKNNGSLTGVSGSSQSSIS